MLWQYYRKPMSVFHLTADYYLQPGVDYPLRPVHIFQSLTDQSSSSLYRAAHRFHL